MSGETDAVVDSPSGSMVSEPVTGNPSLGIPATPQSGAGGNQPTPEMAAGESGSGGPQSGASSGTQAEKGDNLAKHNLPPDQTILKDLVTDQELKLLWDRADAAQQRVNAEVRNFNLARFLLNQIQSARNQILAGKANYDDSERALNEVEFRLAFNQGFGERTRRMTTILLVYEAAWLVILATGVVLLNLQPGLLNLDANQLVTSVAWGGLGAVVGGLYALWKHAADAQDFDEQYQMWYLTNPILGISVGAFVFLVVRAGLFSLVAGSSQTSLISSAWLIYAAAWIAGFKQNVVYQVVHRILNAFQVNDSGTTPQVPPSQPNQ